MGLRAQLRRFGLHLPGTARQLGKPTRALPERIVFEPETEGDPNRPAVRIFLGTEPAQWRAERTFLWSIAEKRDRSRRYEIYRMENLEGFDPRHWTTGFTNYRFAIPAFAGGQGKALYNDVDQIYRADPAQLFDMDLEGAGFMALSDRELSVMLVDCERMAGFWSLEDARGLDKKELLSLTAEQAGLRSDLPSEWNVRDGEEVQGDAKLLHFTTLHTQPWRPFPDRYAYREGPCASIWKETEDRADRAAFEAFGQDYPSDAMARCVADGSGLPTTDPEDRQMLRMLATLTPGEKRLELEDRKLLDWLASPDAPASDGLLVPSGLEALPELDQGWALRKLFSKAGRFLFVAADAGPATSRFVARFQRIALRHEQVHWELFVRESNKRMRHYEGGRFLGRGDPRTWVIVDERAGNETQAIGLAEALGWSYECHRLKFGRAGDLHPRIRGASLVGLSSQERSALKAPWPDLVISAGRRAAPVAQWVRERAQGRTRVVHLGRKGGAAAELCDLVVTPEHARLWPHPKRLETVLPLSRVDDDELARAADRWKSTMEAEPRDGKGRRIGVLVGGETRKFRFGEAEARSMAADLDALAQKLGGRLWVTTSPRTGTAPERALAEALPEGAQFFPWRAEGPETPYMGILALSDLLVVTGESESMLAEACATDHPVMIYPMPVVGHGVGLTGRLVDHLLSTVHNERPNDRGTVRPQRGLARHAARWIDGGLIRPTRDLQRLHERLMALGRVEPFSLEPKLENPAPLREAPKVAERVRRIMGVGPGK